MVYLSARTWDEISKHAEETFPEECCGAILIRDGHEEVYRMTNVQNAMHEKDPEKFPRDARTAYLPDSKELYALHEEVDRSRAILKVLYHSHPNHDAYFSPTDKQAAMWGDEPSRPDTAHVVISIYDRQVRDIKAYQWEEATKDFVETELRTNV